MSPEELIGSLVRGNIVCMEWVKINIMLFQADTP
jgi:hypothetical protein